MEKNPSTPSLLHPTPVHRRLLAGGLLAGFSVVAGAGAAAAAAPTTVDAGVRTVAGAAAPISPAALPVTWRGDQELSGSGTRFVTLTL